MKKYIGTKTIMAMPMAKSEAEKVLSRSLDDAKGKDMSKQSAKAQ